MAETSPYQQLRQLEFSLRRSVPIEILEEQGPAGRRALEKLQRDVRASKDVMKDYEMFELEEDTRMQARTLPKAVKSLERTRESLLKASEYELVGAADVAQMSAQLDELIDKLR